MIVSDVPGHDARHDRHRARRGTTRPSCSSTRPACGASAASARASSTTRSSGRSRPPSGPTSRSCSSTRAEGVVEQDLAVADVARKAGCSTLVVLSKWDITDGRPAGRAPRLLNRRLRQRPPSVAVSAHTGRGLERLLDHVEALFAKHVARIPTPELNRALGELQRGASRPGRGARPPPEAPLRDADGDAPAAAPRLRQRPAPRDPRLRLLGRERAARAVRARRASRRRSTSSGRSGDGRRRRRRRLVGDGVRPRCSRDHGHDGDARVPRSRRRPRRSRETGPEPALRDRRSTSPASRRRRIAEAPRRGRRTSSSSPCRARAFARRRAARCPVRAPILSLTKGLDPATGDRLSTARRATARSPSSRARTSRTRSSAACPPRP